MEIKESAMRCQMNGCGYSHHERNDGRKVYSFSSPGFHAIILCEKCVKEMHDLMVDIQTPRIPRVDGKTGEVKYVKKPQRKKVEPDE